MDTFVGNDGVGFTGKDGVNLISVLHIGHVYLWCVCFHLCIHLEWNLWLHLVMCWSVTFEHSSMHIGHSKGTNFVLGARGIFVGACRPHRPQRDLEPLHWQIFPVDFTIAPQIGMRLGCSSMFSSSRSYVKKYCSCKLCGMLIPYGYTFFKFFLITIIMHCFFCAPLTIF